MLEIGRLLGAERIVGVCSSTNADVVRSYGADSALHYSNLEQLEAFLRDEVAASGPFRMILDCGNINGHHSTSRTYELLLRSLKTRSGGISLRLGGYSIGWLSAFTPNKSRQFRLLLKNRYKYGLIYELPDMLYNLTLHMICLSCGDLAMLARWLKEGALRTPPIRMLEGLTYENITEAFETLRSGHVRGKIAIRVMEGRLELKPVLETVQSKPVPLPTQAKKYMRPALQQTKEKTNLQSVLQQIHNQ